MRKFSILMLVLSLFVTIIAGCNGGSTTQTTGNGGPADPVELVYWTFNDLHQTIYEFGAEKYNEKYPNQPIILNGEVYPNAEMHNNLLIATQSGVGAPDIVDINLNFFGNFITGDIPLVPLNDIVEPIIDNFVKSRFDIYAKDGTYYGAPTHVGATVVYYNMEILDAAGVDVDSINTWDDYVAAGKKVVAETGIPMTAFEVANQRPFWPMIVQRGGDYLASDGSVALDSEINIEVLEFMEKMMFEDEIAVAAPGGSTAVEEFWTFMNGGGIASLIMPSWFMSRFLNYMPDLEGKVAIRPMPIANSGDPRSVGIGGTATSIINQSEHIDIAKKVVEEAKLTYEANVNIWETLAFDPPRTDVWDDPILTAPMPYFYNESFFEILEPYKDNIPSPVNTEDSAAAQSIVMDSVMYKVFVERSATPREALEEGAAELRAQQAD